MRQPVAGGPAHVTPPPCPPLLQLVENDVRAIAMENVDAILILNRPEEGSLVGGGLVVVAKNSHFPLLPIHLPT